MLPIFSAILCFPELTAKNVLKTLYSPAPIPSMSRCTGYLAYLFQNQKVNSHVGNPSTRRVIDGVEKKQIEPFFDAPFWNRYPK
jgi:hypothetical protein